MRNTKKHKRITSKNEANINNPVLRKKMELQNKSSKMIYFAAPYREMTQF